MLVRRLAFVMLLSAAVPLCAARPRASGQESDGRWQRADGGAAAQASSAGDAEARRPSPEERQQINDRFVAQVKERIAGRENEPAGKVFRNIRFPLFKPIPAGNLLDIMNGGYSRGLGVTCTHCHVETDFASDEKRPKRAAREMAFMHRAINQQLAKLPDLESDPEDRSINCGTCHRGSLRPQKARVPQG